MYEQFYGLQAKPFRLSPDPHFFFTSATHKSALAYLRYGLYQGEGFIIITGAAGTGKTTLMRTLLGELPRREMVIGEVMTTQLQADDLLRSVAASFDLDARGAKSELIGRLHKFFVARRRAGQRVLLVVDEAHNLPQSSCEELRMLSNFQQGAHTLLQCILLGQPPLRDTLARANMEQFQQRVIAAHHLHSLDAQETRAYILHRLRLSGWCGDPSFGADALARIYRYSSGIPRRINMLCDRLMLYGSLEALHHLDARAITQVYGEWAAETGQGIGHEPPIHAENGVSLAGLDHGDAVARVEPVSSLAQSARTSAGTTTATVHETPAAPSPMPNPEFAAVKNSSPWRSSVVAAAMLAVVAILFSFWPEPSNDERSANAGDVTAPPSAPHVDAQHVAPALKADFVHESPVVESAAASAVVAERQRIAPRLSPHELNMHAQEVVDVNAALALASTDAAPTPPPQAPRVARARPDPHDINAADASRRPPTTTPKRTRSDSPVRSAAVAPSAGSSVAPMVPPSAEIDEPALAHVVAEPALDVAPGALSEQELAEMLVRFQGAYEGGDMDKLVDLFARDARSDDAHDREAIARTYRKLFNVTDARHLALKDVRWTEEGGAMRGEGQFGVTVREKGRDIESHYTGRIRLRIEKRDGVAVITRLEHHYAQ